jgi:hypothetical protein
MQYETYTVVGAITPQPNDESAYENLAECANEISGIYKAAAAHGGKVIGGHTLECDVLEPARLQVRELSNLKSHIMSTLFLVVEFPDDVDVDGINRFDYTTPTDRPLRVL